MKVKKNIAISDTGFVFDPSTGDSYTLNSTGLEIVQMIKSGLNNDEIKEAMTHRYDVDAHSFERYFMDFLGMLKNMQLVTNNEE